METYINNYIDRNIARDNEIARMNDNFLFMLTTAEKQAMYRDKIIKIIEEIKKNIIGIALVCDFSQTLSGYGIMANPKYRNWFNNHEYQYRRGEN